MGIGTDLKYAKLEELSLDPFNPRLGRNNTGEKVTQTMVLDIMQDWTLDELAISYLESGGFWTHEALLVTKEKLYGKNCLVVIEGNRRLAALSYLQDAINKNPANSKWRGIAKSGKPAKGLFTRIPYVEIDSREDIESFLGFRHVTGIKEWKPPEKAEYIAKLIDERKMTYSEVMRKIGSTTPTVRQNYISYRMLLQIENTIESVPASYVEDRFSVMYLSLRTTGVQEYLKIDISAEPNKARTPVPRSNLRKLDNYSHWLFGSEKNGPLIRDSRQVDDFGRILESKKGVDYLERNESPNFEVAFRIAGGDETQITRLIAEAADNVELALGRVHAFTKSNKVQRVVDRLGGDVLSLLDHFPKIRDGLFGSED